MLSKTPLQTARPSAWPYPDLAPEPRLQLIMIAKEAKLRFNNPPLMIYLVMSREVPNRVSGVGAKNAKHAEGYARAQVDRARGFMVVQVNRNELSTAVQAGGGGSSETRRDPPCIVDPDLFSDLFFVDLDPRRIVAHVLTSRWETPR